MIEHSFTFENQGTNTYLVYTVKPTDFVDSMSLGMLTNNKINGLAATLFMQVDTTKYIKYNVSAKISVKQFFAGPVNKKRLVGVFSGILNAMLSAEDYMINVNTILLDLDYIFVDVSTCETVLICLPIESENTSQIDLGAFFKNIVFSTQFDQTENCDYVAKIINYLNSTPVFSTVDFSGLLREIAQESGTVQTQMTGQNPVIQKAVQGSTLGQPMVQQSVNPQSVVQQAANPQPVVQQSVNSQPAVEKVVQQPVVQPTVSPQNQQPARNQNFAVPGQQSAQLDHNMSGKSAEADTGKKMSMFYLLQHYSKENAATYKAQKDAQKALEKEHKSNKETKKTKKEKKTEQGNAATNFGFAVPGSGGASGQGFAVPGQQSPAQQSFTQPKPVAQPVQQMSQNVSQPIQQTPQSAVKPVQGQPQAVPFAATTPAYTPSAVPQGQPMNFGETTVLGGGVIGETTVLSAAQNPAQVIAPHLIRKKNNEKISLNKPVFRIGKEKSYVDYFVGDNTAVSRSHANFISREGEYFVVDTNSTNHTFLNGAMIQSNEEMKITHGDTIRLANEEFVFYTH